jgi:hypothetical protein
MNTNIPKNYNNGKKKKGKATPNFSFLRSHEQSLKKDRAVNGLYFSGVYVDNEDKLKNVHQKRNKVLQSRYAILNVLNKETGEYYKQPYFIRDIDAVNLSADDKNILNTIPKVGHKKLKKEIKQNPNNYLCFLSDIGKFNNLIEFCFYDLDVYNGDNSLQKYNRNINYSNIIAKGKQLFAYEITQKLNYLASKNRIDSELLTIDFRDIAVPVKVTLGNTTISLDAYDIYRAVETVELLNLFNSFKNSVKVKEVANKEVTTEDKPKFKKNVYVILNKTEGKVKYVAEGLFSNLDDYMSKQTNKGSLKRSYERGDDFEVLTYTCTNKLEYKELTRKSKFAASYRKINLKLSQFDVTNLLDMYDDYCSSVWENYNQTLFVKKDIRQHLNVVYSHIHDYIKGFKKETEQVITCPVQTLILNHFDVNSFKQAWHKKLFHNIVTDQKVFLKKADLNKVLLEFSIHSQRMSKEIQRRSRLTETAILLDDKKAGLSQYTSINKNFCQGTQNPHAKDRDVAQVVSANSVSLGDIPTPTAVNFVVSDAPTDDSGYLDSLVSYIENSDYYDHHYSEWLAE